MTLIVDEDIKESEPEEKVQTNEEGHLGKIKVGDKEYRVVNTVKMVEIMVHKLENGQEISQVIAHEFMMAEHKEYMVKLLTDAIMTVMRAKKRANMVKLLGQGVYHNLRRKMGMIK